MLVRIIIKNPIIDPWIPAKGCQDSPYSVGNILVGFIVIVLGDLLSCSPIHSKLTENNRALYYCT